MKYTIVAHYEITAICESPFRTGNADHGLHKVLLSSDGKYMIQAASIAGSLRTWIEHTDKSVAKTLFGSQDTNGHLYLSDGVFINGDKRIRPRLRIKAKTGTAANKAKFNIAHIGGAGNKKAAFQFTVTWFGLPNDQQELNVLHEALSALHNGDIRLGAQKTNGYGRVTLSIKQKTLDMTKPEEREAWLNDNIPLEIFTLPLRLPTPVVTFTVSGCMGNVLVKAAFKEKRFSNVTVNLQENNQYVLPSSSIRGAFRARCSMIAQAMGKSQDEATKMMDSFFGSNANPGMVIFEDARLQMTPRTTTRIRLSKTSGTVIQKSMVSEAPLSGRMSFSIKMPNQPDMCGLMLYAVRDLGLGLVTLGSGSAVGRGIITDMKLVICTPGGNATMDASGKIHDPSCIIQGWFDSMKGGSFCEKHAAQ